MRDEILISLLDRELNQLSRHKVFILTHSGGDPDSICSAYFLRKLLKEIYNVGNVWIGVPGSPTAHVKALIEYFEIGLAQNVEGVDAYIVVDAGSPEQLDEYFEVISRGDKYVIVIDHHSDTVNRYSPNVKVYSSERYQSVTEVIYDLAEYLGYQLELRDAEAILIGLYYDTVRFSIADLDTSSKICRLISKGIILNSILAKLEQTVDTSERIARLKGASRMKIYRFRDWLVVITNVGKFQSSVARSLINLGAHLAIAIGEVDKSRVAASMRASQDFIEQTKINLSIDLAGRIGVKFGGYGGGHASAAHLECNASIEELAEYLVDELKNRLGINPEVLEA
ncbi:MAG: DHH family phosphoesterase [Nitrososphaerota archaeon]